jgi:hypothetical protein
MIDFGRNAKMRIGTYYAGAYLFDIAPLHEYPVVQLLGRVDSGPGPAPRFHTLPVKTCA